MEGNEFQATLNFVASNLQSGLPYVHGGLRKSVKAIVGNSATDGNVVLGTIVINAPYAQFVNYGYMKYRTSTKLKRDYMLVERITLNTLKSIYQAKGAKVSWK